MKKFLYFIQLSFILMWCSLSYALDLSNVKDFFKTQNNPPTELFGIKLFENINNYSQETILFQDLEDVYEDLEIPFFEKIKYFDAKEVVKIKNPKFDSYYLYIDEKLQIRGISADTWGNMIEEDHDLQKCLSEKNQLVYQISDLYDLSIDNFREQNYIWSDKENPEYDQYKNDIASASIFKFDQNEIKLIYSISCYFAGDVNQSVLVIDLLTEELNDALWDAYLSKTEKSVNQLLNKDLKGF
mgnify:CR=1 FL=1